MGKNGKRKGKGRKSGPPQVDKHANGASNGAPSIGAVAGEPEAEIVEAVPAAPPEQQEAPAEPAPELVASEAGAAWAAPLHRFDLAWTRFEARLLVGVLLAELASLCAWVLLNDLTDPPDKANADGTIFRGLLAAIALGCLGWFGTKRQSTFVRRTAAIGGIVLGMLSAPLWRTAGIAYLDNLKGWLQEGSTLTLMGGLRGVATRLTLWLALLGGSLATGAGRHIHIDLVYRLLPKRFRLPASLVNTAAAALVCFAATWGFVDHIAITSFGAEKDASAATKLGDTVHGIGTDLFLVEKQVGLDARSVFHVLAGERYDHWMTGRAWNAWVDGAGFEGRYTKDQIATIKVPDDTETHTPLVIAPDGTTTRGLLVSVLGLVFPFGLFAIGLRFVLRGLLTLSGHYKTDPSEAHKEDIGRPAEEAV
ncbi:MAG TPA: TRAP transporter small permease subunit [Minicystis sp.]|nr:TRAP transporter small permease subunit [Minicystis sp.]